MITLDSFFLKNALEIGFSPVLVSFTQQLVPQGQKELDLPFPRKEFPAIFDFRGVYFRSSSFLFLCHIVNHLSTYFLHRNYGSSYLIPP